MGRSNMALTTSIETARSENRIWVRISGSGTFKIAPALRDFVSKFIEQASSEVYIDLSGCRWLDSTCLGSLVGLLRTSQPGRRLQIHLNSPSESCLDSLRRMHLDQLFLIESLPLPDSADWEPIVAEDVAREQMADVVIRAHEDLASADPRNEHFGRIAKTFRKDFEAHRS